MQGCSLSTHLFNSFSEDANRNVAIEGERVTEISGTKVNNFKNVDDITIMIATMEETRTMVQRLE